MDTNQDLHAALAVISQQLTELNEYTKELLGVARFLRAVLILYLVLQVIAFIFSL